MFEFHKLLIYFRLDRNVTVLPIDGICIEFRLFKILILYQKKDVSTHYLLVMRYDQDYHYKQGILLWWYFIFHILVGYHSYCIENIWSELGKKKIKRQICSKAELYFIFNSNCFCYVLRLKTPVTYSLHNIKFGRKELLFYFA